ncbi:hypothetical protein K3727_08300 [Rhodobacteraceae bacterium M382]|nr:hypothetical protein K3727_08300 [Rhodobacteraceae bacterium M382]
MGSPKVDEIVTQIRVRFWLLQNASFWILLGVFVGIGYFLLIESKIGGEYSKFWVYGVSALITLFASGVALVGVFFNIENQNRLADSATEAKKRASLAMLPAVLAEIGRRCEHNVFTVLINSENNLRTSTDLDTHFQRYQNAEIKPFIDNIEFQTLKECIEYSDKQSAEILSRIPYHYQVYFSRSYEKDFPSIRKDRQGRVTDNHSLQRAQDWLLLHSLTCHCLEYARGFEDRISDRVSVARLAQDFSTSRLDRQVDAPSIIYDFEEFHVEFVKSAKNDLAAEKDGKEMFELPALIRLGIY